MFIALTAVFYYSNLKMVEIVHITSLRVSQKKLTFTDKANYPLCMSLKFLHWAMMLIMRKGTSILLFQSKDG